MSFFELSFGPFSFKKAGGTEGNYFAPLIFIVAVVFLVYFALNMYSVKIDVIINNFRLL